MIKKASIFLVLFIASMFPGVADAQQSTGSISGRVTSDGSTGIFGIGVYVYESLPIHLGSAQTDSNGDYTVTGLPSGDHLVWFAPSGGYVSEWYDDNPVTVTEGADTPNIDAVLELGGSVSGRVTSDGSTGISGVLVGVYWQYGSFLHTYTDSNGDYTVAGFSSGDYKVQFQASDAGYVDEWYNDKADFYSADPVTVTAPAVTPGIDAILRLEHQPVLIPILNLLLGSSP